MNRTAQTIKLRLFCYQGAASDKLTMYKLTYQICVILKKLINSLTAHLRFNDNWFNEALEKHISG